MSTNKIRSDAVLPARHTKIYKLLTAFTMVALFFAGIEFGDRTDFNGIGIDRAFSYLENRFFTIRYVAAVRSDASAVEPIVEELSATSSQVELATQEISQTPSDYPKKAAQDDILAIASDSASVFRATVRRGNPPPKKVEQTAATTSTATTTEAVSTTTPAATTTSEVINPPAISTTTEIALNPPIATTTETGVSNPSTAPTSTSTATSTAPTASEHWAIRSVSSMKETKDKICNQDSAEFIESWVNRALELGVNYIAVETPYDNPACGSAVAYTKAWVDTIHAKGLNVWHRHAPLEFEGIYNAPKNASKDYIAFVSNYIKANPTFFKEGDIFTPIPEPQNGGIRGITYCAQEVCMFDGAAAFNAWLRNAMTSSEAAFASIGLAGKIKIGYYGFDGFVAWGHNNPDWNGILESETVALMGNVTIDHYPELVGTTMAQDLDELQAKYPNTPIIIGEWGTVMGGDTTSAVRTNMQAAIRPNVVGFNYWHMGMGGNEALLNADLTAKESFDAVKSFFKK